MKTVFGKMLQKDPTGTVKDDITRELDALASDSSVENELAAMKAQLTGGPASRAQIDAPEGAAGQPTAEQVSEVTGEERRS